MVVEPETSRTARALVKGDKHPDHQRYRKAACRPRLLTYRADRFSYVEDLVYDGPRRGAADVRLTLWNENLPDTVVAALPGRCLADLIGYGGIFLAAKATRIVRAEVAIYPGTTALRLGLEVPWYLASRAFTTMR